jgi:hypothetical protein
VDDPVIGSQGFIGDWRRQIYFRRDDYRPSQKSVQSLYLCRLGRGRHEDGHGDTPLRHNDALQFPAADPIKDAQAFRLELAGADDPTGGHTPSDWSSQMTITRAITPVFQSP